MRRLPVLAILLTVAACNSDAPKAPAIPLGEARLAVPGGHIWYTVSGAGTGTPLRPVPRPQGGSGPQHP